MKGHRRILEATNGGHYFANCGCGWSGGVFRDRAIAAAAHQAHVEGREPEGRVKTTVLFGPPAHRQGEAS